MLGAHPVYSVSVPFLNWKKNAVTVNFGPGTAHEMSLTLALGDAEFDLLSKGLSGVLETRTSELRIDLPSGWTLYFKVREGESRQFLAHPEHNEWVATLALSESHMQSVVKKIDAKEPMVLSHLEEIHSMSNVDVELKPLAL